MRADRRVTLTSLIKQLVGRDPMALLLPDLPVCVRVWATAVAVAGILCSWQWHTKLTHKCALEPVVLERQTNSSDRLLNKTVLQFFCRTLLALSSCNLVPLIFKYVVESGY